MIDTATRLSSALASAENASPSDRIEYRDAIAGCKLLAIEPMIRWLHDPRLSAFAVRVLGKIADMGFETDVSEALHRDGMNVSSPSVRADVDALVLRLDAPAQPADKPVVSPYVNHCWSCYAAIDSRLNDRCSKCHMFICPCGACMCPEEE